MALSNMDEAALKNRDYDTFREYLEDACGIVLGENKHYLVHSRLNRLLKDHAIHSLSDLVDRLKKDPRSSLKMAIIDAMTTNETSWFRDRYPFDILKELILPEKQIKRVSDLRIWSAACSSGQEPYSISMTIQEYLASKPGAFKDIQIVATDISPAILSNAREGLFDDLSVARGLSQERRDRFFDAVGTQWKVRSQIHSRIAFRELNLMESYTSLGKFDLIYCRNVLIYFSSEVKRDIIGRMADALRPGGYLLLGGSESMASYSEKFETVHFKNGLVYKLR